MGKRIVERSKLRIFNVWGRLVHSEMLDVVGLENFVWDGKDQGGNDCMKKTVYFAQYEAKQWKISLW